MQDAPKAVWSIPYVSGVFFPSLKHNFIAYRSSKLSSRPDCIFEIHQLWESDFSRVYSNCRCSCSFEAEIIKIGLSSHKMYSNNIVNFQESTTNLNACTKRSENLLKVPRSWKLDLFMEINRKHYCHYIIAWWHSKKEKGLKRNFKKVERRNARVRERQREREREWERERRRRRRTRRWDGKK